MGISPRWVFMKGTTYTPRKFGDLKKSSKVLVEESIGAVYSNLTVIRYLGSCAHGKSVVECVCSCGEHTASSLSQLKRGGKTSCGCQLLPRLKRINTTHGLSKTREYKIWQGIKDRVFNINDEMYPKYGALGMDESFKDSFEDFMAHIGPVPDDGKAYTVDRIDNTKGYYKGNIRWACRSSQMRNQGVRCTNKTGVTGVKQVVAAGGLLKYVAIWIDLKGKPRSKTFHSKDHGDELAFFMACMYREHQIDLLNLQGAGYTDNHGKESNTFNWEETE